VKKTETCNPKPDTKKRRQKMRDLSLAIPQGVVKKKSKTSVSTYRLNLAIVASTVILGLAYLFVINSLGTKGYEIKKLDEQLKDLQASQKTLQMQASDLQSINRIQEEAQKLNYVPVNNAAYLKDTDFALK
jgi:cell division protein FtsL